MQNEPTHVAPGPAALDRLRKDVERVAHLLPGQGPISVFIHHNTLHFFEKRPFENAVVEAGRLFGCEPFLSEDAYRAELRRARISERDLRAVIDGALGAGGRERVAGLVERAELRFRVAAYGISEVREPKLGWLLREEGRCERLRADLPAEARECLAAAAGGSGRRREAQLARSLWQASLAVILRCGPLDAGSVDRRPPMRPKRHRDWLLDARALDVDAWVNPLLIRFVSAYLDQGLAHWPLAERERGLYAAFAATYGRRLSALAGSWTRVLRVLLRDDASAGRTPLESLEHSLRELGVREDGQLDYLVATALALRGWAGMIRQMEERPDRMPVRPMPARLEDYLAIRLLCDRAALAQAARQIGHPPGDLAGLCERLRGEVRSERPMTAEERAWLLFQVAQLAAIDAAALEKLSREACQELERELLEFDSVERRKTLHLAFERRARHHLYDVLIQHRPQAPPRPPVFQAIFCIDEREESFRRHLEELEPGVETFGAAGFFGVAMYYRGATDARPRPLCPAVILPQHYVAEVREESRGIAARWRRGLERAVALADKNVHVGSRTLARGALLMSLLGTLSLVPLVLRVAMPGLGRRVGRFAWRPFRGAVRSRLRVDREAKTPPIGVHSGFALDEKVAIVASQLENAGLTEVSAPIVAVVGHASVSLNNPHESAHDCGACGGGAGGPNARAFAQMANDPAVRERLARRGLSVPLSTWFVGAQRNTASNEVLFFDEERVPPRWREGLRVVRAAFDRAREAEALERCRRFDALPRSLSERGALRHTEVRAADLAQPRPEYGHATNAFCIVGRRSRTRGLFLDRRAFLVSYDPGRDPDGAVLARILAAVVPVVAGISLEYYFSSVDPVGYGCGTKLPHNVTGLLGVMDGAQSDLRTGLPWQMVEIHEPVRLAIVIECAPARLEQVLAADAHIARLAENRWVYFACLDPESPASPESQKLWELGEDGFRQHAVEEPLVEVEGPSARWFRGKQEHLGFVRILSDVQSEGPSR